jgi:stearoyl-CoA desaturase (Delta-9 desaturase)
MHSSQRSLFSRISSYFFGKSDTGSESSNAETIDWARAIPFSLIHFACFAVIWVGWSWPAVAMAAFLYALRVFTLTAFYHRYFSHRTFKTGRITQFIFGWIGCTSIQRGPLWWAAHHRHHHVHSDDPEDLHSPRQKGLIWAHICWFLTPKAEPTNWKMIPDFARYPEMRWLDRFDLVPPALLIAMLYGLGELLSSHAPGLGCTGLQMVAWFFVSTVAVYHVTYLVNSATHLFGSRRFQTKDDSRNSMVIALLTFGEGWHNNHHHYPNSVRQGFYWWEIDISYYILKMMAAFGLVWELRPVPERVLARAYADGNAPLPTELAAISVKD